MRIAESEKRIGTKLSKETFETRMHEYTKVQEATDIRQDMHQYAKSDWVFSLKQDLTSLIESVSLKLQTHYYSTESIDTYLSQLHLDIESSFVNNRQFREFQVGNEHKQQEMREETSELSK